MLVFFKTACNFHLWRKVSVIIQNAIKISKWGVLTQAKLSFSFLILLIYSKRILIPSRNSVLLTSFLPCASRSFQSAAQQSGLNNSFGNSKALKWLKLGGRGIRNFLCHFREITVKVNFKFHWFFKSKFSSEKKRTNTKQYKMSK